jgi:hypothetical protein
MDQRAGDPDPGGRPEKSENSGREPPDGGGSAFPSRYEVHVHGRLSAEILADYPLLAAGSEQVETILVGVVRDQAELSGLVLRLQDDGLEVTEFRRLPD